METGTPFKRHYGYYATSVFCKRTWSDPACQVVGGEDDDTMRRHVNPAERHQDHPGLSVSVCSRGLSCPACPCRPPLWPARLPWMARPQVGHRHRHRHRLADWQIRRLSTISRLKAPGWSPFGNPNPWIYISYLWEWMSAPARETVGW